MDLGGGDWLTILGFTLLSVGGGFVGSFIEGMRFAAFKRHHDAREAFLDDVVLCYKLKEFVKVKKDDLPLVVHNFLEKKANMWDLDMVNVISKYDIFEWEARARNPWDLRSKKFKKNFNDLLHSDSKLNEMGNTYWAQDANAKITAFRKLKANFYRRVGGDEELITWHKKLAKSSIDSIELQINSSSSSGNKSLDELTEINKNNLKELKQINDNFLAKLKRIYEGTDTDTDDAEAEAEALKVKETESTFSEHFLHTCEENLHIIYLKELMDTEVVAELKALKCFHYGEHDDDFLVQNGTYEGQSSYFLRDKFIRTFGQETGADKLPIDYFLLFFDKANKGQKADAWSRLTEEQKDKILHLDLLREDQRMEMLHLESLQGGLQKDESLGDGLEKSINEDAVSELEDLSLIIKAQAEVACENDLDELTIKEIANSENSTNEFDDLDD